MYNTLKKIIWTILPKPVVHHVKPLLRYIYSLSYVGNRVYCECCKGNFSSWVVLENGDEICPRCGSLPRTRRLSNILSPVFLEKYNKILHFSPSAVLKKNLTRIKKTGYYPTDYLGEFEANYNYNIEEINTDDNVFDLIICYHVLEHIENDSKAMSELYRVLRPKGLCIIQTPFKDGDIYEDESILDPKEREHHFGQRDHVRIYSIDGLRSRLESENFTVLSKIYKGNKKKGLRNNETVLFASKG